jgi:hypothetical protein
MILLIFHLKPVMRKSISNVSLNRSKIAISHHQISRIAEASRGFAPGFAAELGAAAGLVPEQIFRSSTPLLL